MIDDYAESRRVTCQVLALNGHVCESVANAPAARRSIERFRPDVIILEWCLRDGSGRGLACELRALSEAQGQRLFIVVVSALEQPADFTESVDAYFVKPARLSEVEAACNAPLVASETGRQAIRAR